jgi:hypothetical protein
MELRIDGLSDAQCRLLDYIWAMQESDEFDLWFSILPYRTKQEVESLLELIRQEIIENDLNMDSLSEARAYIDNIRSW